MMLACRRIAVGYNGSAVLEDFDFEIDEGEIVTLVGANGAGKSTLVRAISGVLPLMAGDIWFDGDRIDSLSAAERVRRGICHVPEGRQMFTGMTVAENLQIGAYVHRRVGQGAATAKQIDEVCAHFPLLRERMHDLVGNFSGGQQQMLAIARGLMSRPRLMMLDEPSLGLSPLLVAEVFQWIRQLRDRGHSILLSEQNARSALAIADRGYVIENGRVALTGPAGELLASKEIAERYLGVGAGHASTAGDPRLLAAQLSACIETSRR